LSCSWGDIATHLLLAKVFRVNTETLEVSVDAFEEAVTCLALRRDGAGVCTVSLFQTAQYLTPDQLACTTASGFALLEGSTISHLKQPIPAAELPHTRFNDGGCDSKGRFFAGTIYDENRGIPGKLYRYDPATEACEVVDEGPFTARYSLILRQSLL